MADVCPRTRLRCLTPSTCNSTGCQCDPGIKPITERDLKPQERYRLTLAEAQAARKNGTAA